jgi:hypothetical protein
MKTKDRPLHAVPLGRPPRFKDPVMMPPFTAERKVATAVQRLMAHHRTTKSEILRRAVIRGLKAMLAEMKAEGED